jgi:hypothetical protein
LLGGPAGWSRAAIVGRLQARYPVNEPKLQPFPTHPEDCPEVIRALAPELHAALKDLLRDHLGIGIQLNARERAQRRIQRRNARTLLQMMIKDDLCEHAAH